MQNNQIFFCKNCVESNQRFTGSNPYKDQINLTKERAEFDDDGICKACKYFEKKKKIDWSERENEFKQILDQYRSKDGSYDVLVPGSGGKDSIFVSHLLKYKYSMNPLTVTWAPHMYTDIGWKNFQSWINSGFDNILYTPNTKVHRKLTQLSFKNLLHPFQPFVMGQHSLSMKVAVEKNIKLIVNGDTYAERAVGGSFQNTKDGDKHKDFLSSNDNEDLFFGGVHIKDLIQYGISKKDLHFYLPLSRDILEKSKIRNLDIPYFINYNPQSNYYFAIENSGFKVNPDGRSEGTYTKYTSLDDKIDGLHYYTWFIKTGRGRATEDAGIEIRNEIITRDEGVSLVKKFDGEFPKKYFKEILEYLSLDEIEFNKIIDKFRPDHLWKKVNNKWELKSAVWKNKD